jgi:anti-anti-sigma factor
VWYDKVLAVRLLDERIMDDLVVQEVCETLINLVKIDGQTRLVVNFAAVRALVSRVLAVLFNLAELIEAQGGKMAFCGISPELLRGFKIIGLDKRVKICKDEREAAEHVKK